MPGIPRHRVSGILGSMQGSPITRISGTYWERLLLLATPIPLVAAVALFLKGGSSFTTFPWEACPIMLAIVLMIWIVDCEPVRRFNPVELLNGDVLSINSIAVDASSILSITPLIRFMAQSAPLLEITYRTAEGDRTVHILSKPYLAPLGLFTTEPKTLRLLIKHHPELENRVQPLRLI